MTFDRFIVLITVFLYVHGAVVLDHIGGDAAIDETDSDTTPGGLSRMTYWISDGDLYLFGGEQAGQQVTNNGWYWDNGPMRWNSYPTNCVPGINPTPRYGALSWFYDDTISIYGGFGQYVSSCTLANGTGPLQDAYTRKIEDSRWSPESFSTPNPGPRIGSSTWKFKGSVFLYGGIQRQGGTPLSDVWSSDGTQWTQWTSSSPMARSDAMTFQTSVAVYIFGGMNAAGQPLNDTIRWTAGSNNRSQWQVLNSIDLVPSARSGAITWTTASTFFMYGGYDSSSQDYLNDWWSLNIDDSDGDPTLTWTLLVANDATDQISRLNGGNPRIGARAYGAGWVMNGDMYLFGGYGIGDGNSMGHLSDFWKVSIESDSTYASQPSSTSTISKQHGMTYATQDANNDNAAKAESDQSGIAIIAGSISLFVVIVVIIVVILLIRRRARRTRLSPLALEMSHPSDRASTLPETSASRPTSASASRPTSAPASASKITGIKIVEIVGRGNFGEVYQGMWGRRKVALKKLNQMQSEQMQKEANILESLAHPNIVGYYGIAVIDEQQYMVMEFANGGSLLSWLHQHRDISQLTFLEWILDVANGMEYLSNRGILHKDLALRNLLMASDETGTASILVSDFGLASSLDGKNYYTRQEETPLPVKWSAPEALLFNRQSTAGDVWSFGVVVWEMYSHGANPYAGMSNRETTEYVSEGGRLKQPKECPDAVYEMVMRCWDHEPEKRPTFSEIVKTVEKIIADMGGTIKELQRQMDHPSPADGSYYNTDYDPPSQVFKESTYFHSP
eukprot:TRINITY_DN502_c2_g1_i1.p1 TRINITY_DN502_c2_g1~~TRINITY_DN502_c2_g1_i1.p1  ORF type:complete len:788 (-),score=134.62 TRINITY_DN502_c2_g1_i1:13-2376(-)